MTLCIAVHADITADDHLFSCDMFKIQLCQSMVSNHHSMILLTQDALHFVCILGSCNRHSCMQGIKHTNEDLPAVHTTPVSHTLCTTIASDSYVCKQSHHIMFTTQHM